MRDKKRTCRCRFYSYLIEKANSNSLFPLLPPKNNNSSNNNNNNNKQQHNRNNRNNTIETIETTAETIATIQPCITVRMVSTISIIANENNPTKKNHHNQISIVKSLLEHNFVQIHSSNTNNNSSNTRNHYGLHDGNGGDCGNGSDNHSIGDDDDDTVAYPRDFEKGCRSPTSYMSPTEDLFATSDDDDNFSIASSSSSGTIDLVNENQESIAVGKKIHKAADFSPTAVEYINLCFSDDGDNSDVENKAAEFSPTAVEYINLCFSDDEDSSDEGNNQGQIYVATNMKQQPRIERSEKKKRKFESVPSSSLSHEIIELD